MHFCYLALQPVDVVRIEVLRQTHVITPIPQELFHVCLGQVGNTHSEAAEGVVVCSAAMGKLDTLPLKLPKARLLPWLHVEQALLLAVPPLITIEGEDNGDIQYSNLAHAQRLTVTGTMEQSYLSQPWQRPWI